MNMDAQQTKLKGLEDTQQPDRKFSTRNQYIAAATCALACFCCGTCSGWASYAVPILASDQRIVFAEPISSTYASLVGSLPNMGAVVGTPLFGWLFDAIGRKRGGMLLAVPLLISWMSILLAPSAEYVLAARFLAGVSIGGGTCLPPLYTGETAETSIRGALGSFLALGFGCGVLLSFCLGFVAGYRTVAMVLLSLVFVYALLMSFMPETPVYLLRKGLEDEAAKSLAWLRRASVHSPVVRDEISYLRMQIKCAGKIRNSDLEDILCNKDDLNTLEHEKYSKLSEEAYSEVPRPAWKQLATDRPSRNAFLMAAALFTFQGASGLYAVQAFAADIFSMTDTHVPPNLCSIALAVMLVLGSLTSTVLADRAGRKFLMVLSCGGIAGTFLVIGYTLQTGRGPAYLPAICLCLSMFMFMVGAGSVPFVVLGEYFPSEVRDLATCLLIQYSCFVAFWVVHSFRPGVILFGACGMFYIFSGVSLVAAIFCLAFQPETKGLTLEEIVVIFGDTRVKSNSNLYTSVK